MSLPAFQLLLDAYRADVYRYLVATVGPDDADDCFQETFLSALHAYDGLSHADNLRGWLFTIAHRKAMDAHRRRGRAPQPVAQVPERAEHPPVAASPEVWESVRRLTPAQRSAIVLRVVHDLDYASVAAALDCSQEAARQRVHAGLARLREEWRP